MPRIAEIGQLRQSQAPNRFNQKRRVHMRQRFYSVSRSRATVLVPKCRCAAKCADTTMLDLDAAEYYNVAAANADDVTRMR